VAAKENDWSTFSVEAKRVRRPEIESHFIFLLFFLSLPRLNLASLAVFCLFRCLRCTFALKLSDKYILKSRNLCTASNSFVTTVC